MSKIALVMVVIMDLSVLILAGGKSSRMGQDKALLTLDHTTFIERVYASVSFLSPIAVMTPWPDRYRSLLSDRVTFIPESTTTAPMQALATSWDYIDTAWILLLPCDVPLLSQTEVKAWLETLRLHHSSPNDSQTDAIAILPRTEQGWDCLTGFYHRRSQDCLHRYIQTNHDFSFQRWLGGKSIKELPIRDRRCLFNCNNPSQYQKLGN
jgi:molybdopterin-guanine dinucleotide biosynthesis protein A